MVTRPTYIDEEEEVPVSVECRRKNYEVYFNQRTYCSVPEKKCVFMDDYESKYGYRCMMLEKQI